MDEDETRTIPRRSSPGLRTVLGVAVAVGVLGIGCEAVVPIASPPLASHFATVAPPPDGSVASVMPGLPGESCAAPATPWVRSIQVGVRWTGEVAATVSFGLPVPAGVLRDPRDIRVSAGGRDVDATIDVLLQRYDGAGAPLDIQAILIQFPAAALGGDDSVEVGWTGGSSTVGRTATFDAVSVESEESAEIAGRTISVVGGTATLQETSRSRTVLFTAREPSAVATFPDGYLASTGILGCQVAGSSLATDFGGIGFMSSEATPFALSAMYQESYAINPDSVYTLDPDADVDPSIGYEGWLYDRCATFLALYAHTGDDRFLREGFRQCSYYERRIALGGDVRGIFTDKSDPDPKYSHLRGLYAYYALTGDEAALAAGTAIADLWLTDQEFVAPYRNGRLRGPDKLWTERLLATSLEGVYYGHLLTGRPDYLDAVRDLVETAFEHVTGDASRLATMNPGTMAFPAQDCFIHTAEQAAEGDADQPFCSGWMPALLVAPLLAYERQTRDARVGAIFIRLTRFLRDVGTAYFTADLLDDSFLHPSVAYDAGAGADRRRLVPLYGAGLDDAHGSRTSFGEYDDAQHCLDAAALVAAGIRSLRRSGGSDANPIGPFPTEGASFEALFVELAACAELTFQDQTRSMRDPARWTSADLAAGMADPARFIGDQKIGYPIHNVSPRRKLSWWFNPALETFGLLRDVGVGVRDLQPGFVQPTT